VDLITSRGGRCDLANGSVPGGLGRARGGRRERRDWQGRRVS